jgi:V/A-type H+-transporting ATPase subunit D
MSVVPTKMELSRLRKRLKTSQEAHKLLKDKQDELMRKFISLLREKNEIRQGVNASVNELSVQAGLSVAGFPYKMVQNLFLVKETLISARVERKNWMGVSLVDITFDYPNEPQPSSALVSSPLLSQTEHDMRSILPDLLRMTQMEKNCYILANEIEALRRRVNALEHMVIPNLEQDIRMIRMKLSDNERDTITRLIKIKGMEE